MYLTFLTLHSLFRWLVLISLLLAVFRAYQGWLGNRSFTANDHKLRHYTATIAHIQLLLGLGLYFLSPVIEYFLSDFSNAVHQRPIRFFGMEHSLMMIIAVVLITTGSAKAKRKTSDKDKFKTMAVWFSIALLVILTSVPWPFSPLVARPYFRSF